MEAADGSLSHTIGLSPQLRLAIGGLSLIVQAQVVEHAPFDLLLGQPFFTHTRARVQDISEDEQVLHLADPSSGETIGVPTFARSLGNQNKGPPAH